MLDNLSWLGEKEELAFQKKKFRGKAAGKSWKYAQCIDGLIITRAVILLMSALVFYPILTNYLFHDFFSSDLFTERLVFSILFLIAGLIFNKYRITAIITAAIPLVLMLITYLAIAGQFNIYRFGFTLAVLFLVLRGIHYNKQSKKIRKELEKQLLENQLIEE